MKTVFSSLAFLAGLFLMSCSQDAYVNVEVQNPVPGGPKHVGLEVMNDNVIHVSATPEDSFKDPESLVVLQPCSRAEYEVFENGDTVVVQTSEVKAHVLRTTGEVWFTDLDGNMLLREQNGGGKSFEPIEVDGTHGYSFRQVFESPDDEAFYGLGQHQADEFNYKGKNEELFQYNTRFRFHS